jgi:hypothetical protein
MQTFCSKPIVVTDLIQFYKNLASLSEKDKINKHVHVGQAHHKLVNID